MNMKNRGLLVDDATWEAVREAAYRARISMGEWVRRAIISELAPATVRTTKD